VKNLLENQEKTVINLCLGCAYYKTNQCASWRYMSGLTAEGALFGKCPAWEEAGAGNPLIATTGSSPGGSNP
jgi:hypothetical protein